MRPGVQAVGKVERKEEARVYVQLRGQEVWALREDRGLSRQEFAQASGIGLRTLTSVEGGRSVRLATAQDRPRAGGRAPSVGASRPERLRTEEDKWLD